MNDTMSQGCTRNKLQIKKNYLLNAQVKVVLPQVKMFQESFFLGYEMLISFQASVATSQDNFFKIP